MSIYYTDTIMVEFQIRRHSIQGSSKHLSIAGVKLAKLQNEKPFDLVITSPIQRAMETAIALGSAITETNEILGFLPKEVQVSVPYSAGFEAFKAALNNYPELDQCRQKYELFFRACLSNLESGQRALFISHAGAVEMLILACLPNIDLNSLPHSVSQLEGASITYDGSQFKLKAVLRVDPNTAY